MFKMHFFYFFSFKIIVNMKMFMKNCGTESTSGLLSLFIQIGISV